MRETLERFAPNPKQVLWGLLTAVVVFGGLIGIAYARTNIPSPSTLAAQQTTTIYYSDGKTKLATIGDINRTDVPLSQVPKFVQNAVLAAEDRHFFSEPGISPTGIIRALLVDLKGGDISQGGSTITQQYAKNAYLSPKRTLTRKLKEILIATKLGQTESKDKILEDYLNTVYFGRGAYGIQAASIAYFGHGVAQLTRSQGALLATVIRAPSLYDPRPATNRANAVQRWEYVKQGMLSQHWVTQSQAAKMHFPSTKPLTAQRAACGVHDSTCYIRDAVEYELRTQDGLTQSQLDLGGYKIVTTIKKQDEDGLVAAENAILPKNNNGTPESGAAAIQPGDGAIRALYGGANYCGNTKHNPDACIDLSGTTGGWARPPGSSFKVFTMLAALKSGDFSLNSTFDGPYTVDVDGTPIHNSTPGESCYGCSMTRALAESINTIFVPLAKQVGPQKVVNAAYAAGIPTTRKLGPFPDISLGPNDVSPLDLADAYATIAAQGTHADPYLVQSVTTNSGQRVYHHTVKTTTGVFSKAVTADATYAMQQVLRPGGTAYGRGLSGRPAAGKTGTTDANTNAWFTGFTPQLCLSVWIGNHDRNKTVAAGGVGEVFGGTLPAEIWQSAMNAAMAGLPVEQFPPPAHVGVTKVQSTHTATPSSTPTRSQSPRSKPTPVVTITPPPVTSTPTPTPTATTKPTPTPTSSPTSGGTVGHHGGGSTSSPTP